MIDITKPIRTRDGTTVDIVSDKGRDVFPLLGYIGTSRELDKWTLDGKYYGPNSTSYSDLENYKPEPQPEEWAAEKAAFAAGKAIQYRSDSAPDWTDSSDPFWFSSSDNNFNPQYRIKPEPQWVPLGPEDVPPGSVIRGAAWQNGRSECWVGIIEVTPNGVIASRLSELYSWDSLIDKWQIKRPGEDWKPCKKISNP
jgi:hypothetical protein